jgi:hypothetical protein
MVAFWKLLTNSVTLREEYRLCLFENTLLWRVEVQAGKHYEMRRLLERLGHSRGDNNKTYLKKYGLSVETGFIWLTMWTTVVLL